MDEKDYALGFSVSVGVGPKSFQKLLKTFGSAEKAWEASLSDFKMLGIGEANFTKFDAFRKQFYFQEYLNKLRKTKVEFIPFGDKFYPVRLTQIPDPPIGLFVRGNKKLLLNEQSIGVVGARKITSYGRQVTESLVAELCSFGFVIVSGMALGVDGLAHATAVESNGATIAVLGCGVDCPFPRENERLYEEIIDSNGLIISEYPLGMQPNKGTFPARNRVIAGISSSVLITEAAEDSGSLITADHALLQGKKIFAVPGPITSHMSRGSLKLLKQGATLVSSASDIINELGIKNHESGKIKKKLDGLKLSKEERKIVECLETEERTIDELARITRIPMNKLSVILSEMELSGVVKSSSGKFSLT